MDETKGTATTVETSTEEKTTTNTGTETKDSKTGSGAVKTEEQIRAEVEAEKYFRLVHLDRPSYYSREKVVYVP